jgi:hypothetical protein
MYCGARRLSSSQKRGPGGAGGVEATHQQPPTGPRHLGSCGAPLLRGGTVGAPCRVPSPARGNHSVPTGPVSHYYFNPRNPVLNPHSCSVFRYIFDPTFALLIRPFVLLHLKNLPLVLGLFFGLL